MNTLVVICFQISIFAESYTPHLIYLSIKCVLWFAFKLVSLQSHIHPWRFGWRWLTVVICFQISIFAESYTPSNRFRTWAWPLWFAFKLVSLQSHIHPGDVAALHQFVVICFQISIFAESYTPNLQRGRLSELLWFAFKLVSLQSHIHRKVEQSFRWRSCDLLSN